MLSRWAVHQNILVVLRFIAFSLQYKYCYELYNSFHTHLKSKCKANLYWPQQFWKSQWLKSADAMSKWSPTSIYVGFSYKNGAINACSVKTRIHFQVATFTWLALIFQSKIGRDTYITPLSVMTGLVGFLWTWRIRSLDGTIRAENQMYNTVTRSRICGLWEIALWPQFL